MERVLFCSVSIGAGHDLAAQAVIQELVHRNPRCQTKLIDTFKYINPVLNKVIVESYMESLKFNPKIWGYLYKQAEEGDKFIDLTNILSALGSVKMEKLIKDFRPEAVVCTHAFPAGILSLLKAKNKFNVPLICVITDFNIHPFWIHDHIDLYVLPCDELKYQITEYGVPNEKVFSTGIPLRRQFVEKYDKEDVMNKFGLDRKLTVLVMGGGLGLGEIESVIRTLGNCDIDLQIISITGKNDALWAKLKMVSSKNKIKIFGYVENMAEIMAAADVIITKPGGLTSAEVLAMRLPMVIVNPLPGQEDRNTEFLLNSGVAVKVRKIKHLIPQLKFLIENGTRLRQIKEMAALIGRPASAISLVDKLELMTYHKNG